MNEQKPTNFYIKPRTNWKFILIVLVLASFLGGGILGYQWWWQKELRTQITTVKITEKSESEQKINVITDKTKYERNGDVKFTIFNNSSSAIFFASDGVVVIHLVGKIQKYNDILKIWEEPYEIFLTLGYEDELSSRHLVLFPEEQLISVYKHWPSFSIIKTVEPLSLKPEKYRLIIPYYENELCKGDFSYRGNKEICDKERKEVLSNEFVIQGAILPSDTIQPAANFCLEKNQRYDLDKNFYLNTDEDNDKEILGLCWKYEFDRTGLLFVLDKQNNQYKPVLEKEGGEAQRHTNFENLEINDVDKDGIDEIIYGESAWWMAGGSSYLYLYSPKYQEWFWIVEASGEVAKPGIELSPNLDSEKYKIFKEFLLKELEISSL